MATMVCSTCQRRFDSEKSEALPFCSERCRMVDLHHWLDEQYGLQTLPEDEEM